MKTVTVLTVLTGLFVGCGGGGGGSNLDGTWMTESRSGCYVAITFADGDTYVAQDLCISGSTAKDQVDAGTYVLAGDKITLTPNSSSCPSAPDARDVLSGTVTRKDKQLTLSFPANGVTFLFTEAMGDGTASGTIVYGCLDESANTFTPGPIVGL